MTTVLLKLVGYNKDKTIKINKDIISMLDIINYLTENNLLMNEISQIMFINNGKNITNDITTNFSGTDEYPLIIHLLTNKFEIKNEIIKHIYNEDTKPKIDMDIEFEEISMEETDKNNLKLVELFSDSDFVFLLNIIKNKPELLNKVSNYLTNGNIVHNITITELNDEFKYQNELLELIELLNKVNKELKEVELKYILQHFKGNLNLSLRYILNK